MLKQSFIRNRLNTFTFSSTVCHFLLNDLREKGLTKIAILLLTFYLNNHLLHPFCTFFKTKIENR